MSDHAKAAGRKAEKGRSILIALVATAVAGAAGAGVGAAGLLDALVPGRGAAEAGPGRATVFLPLPEVRAPAFPGAPGARLRALLQLEVEAASADHVRRLEPRIVDVLLGFFTVLDARDLDAAWALDRLRGQLLVRVRAVAGEQAVRSVLISELTAQ